MKILKAEPGQHISSVAKDALASGHSHVWHNDKIYRVFAECEDVTAKFSTDLLKSLRDSPWDIQSVTTRTS